MKKVKNLLLFTLIFAVAAYSFAACNAEPRNPDDPDPESEAERAFEKEALFGLPGFGDGALSYGSKGKPDSGAEKDSDAKTDAYLATGGVTEQREDVLNSISDLYDELSEAGPPGPPMPGDGDDVEYPVEPILPPVIDDVAEEPVIERPAPVKPKIPAGQLTSGAWSDLTYYDYWLGLFEPPEGQQTGGGVFSEYLSQWGLETRNLVPVMVTSRGKAVQGARVKLYNAQNALLYSAVTDASGKAYLFPGYRPEGCYVTAQSANNTGLAAFVYAPGMKPVAIELQNATARQELIEIMFVIDTTGSMGDEIAYLKAELMDVVERAGSATGAKIRLAILLYKDHGDIYVTQYYDFTTDLERQQAVLDTVTASGGGDYPEAVDVALDEAVNQQWSSGNTTKLLFHILDAPPHSYDENKILFRDSVITAAQKGIRMIPVASSGIDKLTEFLLRSEAMMTGGTYTFLTDDSGIGGSHLKPTIGKHTVEFLNEQMLRLIEQYYVGFEIAPVPWAESATVRFPAEVIDVKEDLSAK